MCSWQIFRKTSFPTLLYLLVGQKMYLFSPRSVVACMLSFTSLSPHWNSCDSLQLHGQNGWLLWAKKDGPKEMYICKCTDFRSNWKLIFLRHSVSIDEGNDLFAAWIGPYASTFKLSNSEAVRNFEGEDSLYGNTKQVSLPKMAWSWW